MKRLCIFLVAALLPGVVRAQDRLRIERIGLQGYYAETIPTPVRVHVPAMPTAQTIHLDFIVESRNPQYDAPVIESDRFTKPLAVQAGVPLDVDVPILFSILSVHNVRVIETDSQGREIDKASRIVYSTVQGPVPSVAIYCVEDSQCSEAQLQTYPVKRDDEEDAPRSDLRYYKVTELETNWLTYHAAWALVIAGPISGMSAEQGQALEYYLRSGGTLVLVEKEAGDADFLAAYRQGAATLRPIRVGLGRFFRVSSLESKELVKLFAFVRSAGTRRIFQNNYSFMGRQSQAGRILPAVGTSFNFPRLRTLLIWIAVYILVVGLVNFAILRRLRKLEWGWLTVTAAALVFAAGFYFTSSSGRPEHFTLDTATIYWMDEHSPIAAMEMGFRITSPERKPVELSVDDNVFLVSAQGMIHPDSSGAYLGSQITGNEVGAEGWNVQVAPPLKILTPMRRWSLEEFYANGFHEFSGTVHRTSPTALKNDTGVKFRQAMYVDLAERKVYPIPGMAPGQEVDLAGIPSRPLKAPWDEAVRFMNPGPAHERPRAGAPFPLQAYLVSGVYSLPTLQYFGGVVEQPGSIAGLDAPDTAQQNVVLTVVAMDQQ